MKNLIASLFILGTVCFVSCETKKNAETTQDSTSTDTATVIKEETAAQDSVKTDSAKTDSVKK